MVMRNDVGARGPRVVAFGGGHGLYATLSALRILTPHITAVVTVADDGGSSGRIRQEMDVLPPGDLRMALAALCDDSDWGQTWRDVLQYRFDSDGPLGGHSVGNILMVATWQLLHNELDGLDLVGRLLGIRGRVVPMSQVPLQIEADAVDPQGKTHHIVGQATVAQSKFLVTRVGLIPTDPPACPAALTALDDADWVIFGPGSWYTSIIPHLLVPELHEELVRTPAKRALIINVAPDEETRIAAPEHLINVFYQYAPDIRIDAVIIDPKTITNAEAVSEAASKLGAHVLTYPVVKKSAPAAHDPLFLAAALRDVIDNFS